LLAASDVLLPSANNRDAVQKEINARRRNVLKAILFKALDSNLTVRGISISVCGLADDGRHA
jgi:hypothetical protein